MKLSKIIILSALAVLVLGITSFFITRKILTTNRTSPLSQSHLSFYIKPQTKALKEGEEFNVPIYLNGTDAQKVTALDIKFAFDKNFLKLVSATPGTFIDPVMKIKWDEENAWFALSKNPGTTAMSDPTSPILTLKFIALSNSSDVRLSIQETSTVYISETGGATPNIDSVIFSVE